ncbi:subtilisin-like protease SBT1.2 [Asparagus officinalis]|uniref:subtilisin-like protease SBT1.2 n=1 Tax=Asparagus officinalis TaxID=4686 RepID=UPI00098E1802|nr:subtilisin-like protease SBT1.2 [Asparagus officinalis]
MLAIILHLSSFLMIHGQLSAITGELGNNPNQVQTYIVHVQRPNRTNLHHEINRVNYHKSFLPNTTLDSGKPRLVYSYRESISGFAARLTANEVHAMASTDDFLYAYPNRRHPLLTTYTPNFLGLNDRESIWYDSGYGEGVIIGILDTGIFPSHPSFNDKGVHAPPSRWRGTCDSSTCNNKIIGARAFQGGVPTSVDDDSIGHGTHVASIAAGNFVDGANFLNNANGTASGMAPKAHLAIYKVCSRDGCDDSDILAGIDQAIYDNVDIISISIGSHFPTSQEDDETGVGPHPFYEDSIAIGSFSALRHRILTVVAAGNDGPKERTVVNDAPWLLTVGASSTDRRIRATVRLENGTELDGESAYQPETFNSTMLPLVFPGFEGQGGKRGCVIDSFDKIDVKGKIVMCETGYNVTNIEKGKNVKMAGGAAMIILNQNEQGDTTFSEAHVLPAAHISFGDGLKIISYVKLSTNSTPKATIIFRGTQFGALPSPAVASFSSRGPSMVNGGILKPDIVGPGTNILAAWPAEIITNPMTASGSNFNILSGTSMSASHLVGIAALLKSSNPNWPPSTIKSAIMTTADKLDHEGKPIVDEYNGIASPFALGGGHVNPSKANDPGLAYNHHSQSYIRYLCGLGYTDRQIATITQHQIRCSRIREKSAEELNYPSISLSLGSPSRKTIRRKVKNVGEADSVYSVKIEAPEGVRVEVDPYRLQFHKRYERRHFYVTFTAKAPARRKGQVSEGQLSWVSDKHVVKSPISVTFT